MGDQEDGSPGAERTQGFLDFLFRYWIERTRHLVQNQYLWIMKQCSRDGNALPLPSGQPNAAIPHHRLQTFRQILNEIHGMSAIQGGFYFRV